MPSIVGYRKSSILARGWGVYNYGRSKHYGRTPDVDSTKRLDKETLRDRWAEAADRAAHQVTTAAPTPTSGRGQGTGGESRLAGTGVALGRRVPRGSPGEAEVAKEVSGRGMGTEGQSRPTAEGANLARRSPSGHAGLPGEAKAATEHKALCELVAALFASVFERLGPVLPAGFSQGESPGTIYVADNARFVDLLRLLRRKELVRGLSSEFVVRDRTLIGKALGEMEDRPLREAVTRLFIENEPGEFFAEVAAMPSATRRSESLTPEKASNVEDDVINKQENANNMQEKSNNKERAALPFWSLLDILAAGTVSRMAHKVVKPFPRSAWGQGAALAAEFGEDAIALLRELPLSALRSLLNDNTWELDGADYSSKGIRSLTATELLRQCEMLVDGTGIPPCLVLTPPRQPAPVKRRKKQPRRSR